MPALDLLSKITNFLVKREENIKRGFDYLNRFGYISDKQEETIDGLIAGLKYLQFMGGLPITGELDAKTLRLMGEPRCACRDIEKITENTSSQPGWGLSTVTWFVSSYDTEVSKTDWIDSNELALSYWSKICKLKFERVNNINEANIVYDIGRGAKDDFDGPSGTLAWMQLCPSANFKGRVNGKFDQDETWIPLHRSGRGIQLVEVMSHENGHHIIGGHSKRPNALMAPFYRQGLYEPQLDDDVPRAVNLYGKTATNPSPAPQPTPTNPPDNGEESEIVIRLKGKGSVVSVDGYRLQRIS